MRGCSTLARQKVMDVTDDDAPFVKLALLMGYWQHRIAAYLGINQGRISEFKNSPRFGETVTADELPPDFPQK
jgi:hypothetical protein